MTDIEGSEAYYKKQQEYCRKNGLPFFAMRNCSNCRNDVFDHPRTREMAATGLITGCPHCGRSFCD